MIRIKRAYNRISHAAGCMLSGCLWTAITVAALVLAWAIIALIN